MPYRPAFETLLEDYERVGALGFCEFHAESVLSSQHVFEFADTLACCGVPIYLHSTALLLGHDSTAVALKGIEVLCERLPVSLLSGHVADGMHDGPGGETFRRAPYTAELLEDVIDRVLKLEGLVGCRVGLENIACYGHMPADQLEETAFFAEIAARLPGRVIFDISNHLSNCFNQRRSVPTLVHLRSSPIEYFHISGGRVVDGRYLDTHADPIPDSHLSVLSSLVQGRRELSVLYERDGRTSAMAEIAADLAKLYAILDQRCIGLSSDAQSPQ